MYLRVVESTDGKYIGEVVEVPSAELGQMNKRQIQAFALAAYDFVPDTVLYSVASVRLVNSNYSVTLEVMNDG